MKGAANDLIQYEQIMDTTENDTTDALIALTSDIVAAHVSGNNVPGEKVPELIEKIYGALARLGKQGAQKAPPEPAVSIRSSVKPDSVTCLECGKKMKMLKRHLSNDHGMTAEEYRKRWNLGADYPIVAPNYAEKRREIAKQIGLGRKFGTKHSRKRK
jgi:predicted transcriptional regulator